MAGGVETVVESDLPVDLRSTLALLRYGGRWDPCYRVIGAEVWRATRSAGGPATMRLRPLSLRRVHVTAWGPGAEDALRSAAMLIGARDDDGGLPRSASTLVRRLARQHVGFRQCRTADPMTALVGAIIHQKVQTESAMRSYREMVRAAGEHAPGAPGSPRLLLPPTAKWLAAQPSWAWHRWGIEGRRAAAIVTAAACAARVDETSSLPPAAAESRLMALPGIGPWTLAHVATVAWGDPDAVSVGDYWLCHIVCNALAGEVRGTDDRMMELLAPWPGQRGRVSRLLKAAGPKLPRFGPRLPMRDIRDM